LPTRLHATSVRDALQSATGALAAGGCDSPRLDAELLLAHALGTDRASLLREPGQSVAGTAVRAYQAAVRRRAIEREPVAYITGRRAFRELELAVDERVLIPRPETELLVEMGLELGVGARVVDVGTGGGAVALALKHERPDLNVTGSDSSSAALAVARANSERLALEVHWVEADLLPRPPEFDAILSNPPYVASGDRARLAPEIIRHEPWEALDGGPDGLAVISRLVERAGSAPARLLAIEVGLGQARSVGELMRAGGFERVETRPDLAGVERVVVGRR
jgi:release factor glutamine methyltransferase